MKKRNNSEVNQAASWRISQQQSIGDNHNIKSEEEEKEKKKLLEEEQKKRNCAQKLDSFVFEISKNASSLTTLNLTSSFVSAQDAKVHNMHIAFSIV